MRCSSLCMVIVSSWFASATTWGGTADDETRCAVIKHRQMLASMQGGKTATRQLEANRQITMDDVVDSIAFAVRKNDMHTAGLLVEHLGLAYESTAIGDAVVEKIFQRVCHGYDATAMVDNLLQFAMDKLSVGHIGIGAATLFDILSAGGQLASPQGLYLAARVRQFASVDGIEPRYRDAFKRVSQGLHLPVEKVMADWANWVRLGDNLQPILDFERKSSRGNYRDFITDGFNDYVVGSLLVPAVLSGVHPSDVDAEAVIKLSSNFSDARTSLSLLTSLSFWVQNHHDPFVRHLWSTSQGVRLAFRLEEIDGTTVQDPPLVPIPASIRSLVRHPNGLFISKTPYYGLSAGPPGSYGRRETSLGFKQHKKWLLEPVDRVKRFRIKNADLGEYLFAGENRFCRNTSRPVFTTWTGSWAQEDETILWDIVPQWDPVTDGETFTIRNVFYDEYLFADDAMVNGGLSTWRVKGELPSANTTAPYWTIGPHLES